MFVKLLIAGPEPDLAQTEATARRFKPSERKTTAGPGTYFNFHQHKGNKS